MPTRPPSVAVLAYDGLELLDFGIAAEVFGIPRADLGIHYDFRVCGWKRRVRARGGVTELKVPFSLRSLERAGTVVIPGWTRHAVPPPAVLRALRRAAQAGARFVSLYTGEFLLAAAGLLDGRAATVHWRLSEPFRQRFPRVKVVPNRLYLQDGAFFTSAGATAGIDLCLHVIGCDHGAEIASQLARRLVDRAHRAGEQAQVTASPVDAEQASPIFATLDWALAHLDDPLTVRTLAARARMSERTFARHFQRAVSTTPLQWLIHQRTLAAQRYLERTTLPVETIAQRVGLQTSESLRLRFRRVFGLTPSVYRRRFQVAHAPRR